MVYNILEFCFLSSLFNGNMVHGSLFHDFMMMVDGLIASSMEGRENSLFGGI